MAVELFDSSTGWSNLRVTHLFTHRGSRWYAIGSKWGWFELRVTPTGRFRIGKPQKGPHPYFTLPTEEDE